MTRARYIAYNIVQKGERTFWTNLGYGYENDDGSIEFELVLPIEGNRLHIRQAVFPDGPELGESTRRQL